MTPVDWMPWLEEDIGRLWWRFENHAQWMEGSGLFGGIAVAPWRLMRETPKGAWICPRGGGPERHVSHTARRRWAYPTKLDAWQSYCIRNGHWLQHARNALEKAQYVAGIISDENQRMATDGAF